MDYEIFHIIMLVPHNTVLDLNNVMSIVKVVLVIFKYFPLCDYLYLVTWVTAIRFTMRHPSKPY